MDEIEKEYAGKAKIFVNVLTGAILLGVLLGAALLPLLDPAARGRLGRLLFTALAVALADRLVLRFHPLPIGTRLFLFHLINIIGTTVAILLGGRDASLLVVFYALDITVACLGRRPSQLAALFILACLLFGLVVLARNDWQFRPSVIFLLHSAVFALSMALVMGLLTARGEQSIRKRLTETVVGFRAIQAQQERQLNELTETHHLLEERYAETYALYLIEQEIASPDLNQERTLGKVVDIVQGLLGGRASSIFMTEGGHSLLRQVAVAGPSRCESTLPLAGNVLARCWVESIPLSHLDLAAPERAFWTGRGTRGLLCIPIGTKEERVGLILVEYDRLPQSLDDHRNWLTLVAGQVSLALENADLYRRMHELATHDALTGLWNRLYFQDRFAAEVEGASAESPLSVIILDIDHFKKVNDQHGHAAGDEVLRFLARLLRQQLGEDTIIARYGGEEFVVLLPRVPAVEARAIAEEIRVRVGSTPCPWERHTVWITISLGVASYPEAGYDRASLLLRADQGLYHAKRSGRNLVIVA